MLLDDKLCNVHPRPPAMEALSASPPPEAYERAVLVPDKACSGSSCLPHKLAIILPNTRPFDFLDAEEENWLSPASHIGKQIRNSLPRFVTFASSFMIKSAYCRRQSNTGQSR